MTNEFIGNKFNRWTVIGDSTGPKREKYFLCRCDCGSEKSVSKYNVINSVSKSCGCLSAEMLRKRMKKHGMSKTPEYSSWRHMIDRCNNPESESYRWYGAIGITVCNEWKKSFEAFLDDVGPMPSPGLSIDRIDPSCGYFPENVRWADQKTQSFNKKTMKSTLGIKGVSTYGVRFRAYGSEGGKQVHLGIFDSVEQASESRKAWERHHGVTELELLQETKERIA